MTQYFHDMNCDRVFLKAVFKIRNVYRLLFWMQQLTWRPQFTSDFVAEKEAGSNSSLKFSKISFSFLCQQVFLLEITEFSCTSFLRYNTFPNIKVYILLNVTC